MTPQEIYDALSAPFPEEYISWRIGPTNEKVKKDDDPLKGRPLCYVDARAVMDRLDAVMGFDNWQCHYSAGVGASIVCNIGIRIEMEWIWKADGAGPSEMDPDKGALSDAFKRAAVRFGIARYLYDLKPAPVILQVRGRTKWISDDDKKRLNQFHNDFARKLLLVAREKAA